MLGDVEVDDPPAVVDDDDKDKKDAKASGWHRKEIDRDQVPNMIGEERSPGLRGLGPMLGHEAGDGAFGNVDASRSRPWPGRPRTGGQS